MNPKQGASPELRGRTFRTGASRGLQFVLLAVALSAGVAIALLILGGRHGTLKDIQTRGVWRVGMDPSFPPFENLDAASGEVVGLDADLAHGLGDRLGIRTEIVSLGFDELVDAVAAHRIDAAVSALPIMPERTQEVHFSAPYVQAGTVLAVPRESAVRGPADLAGRKVAVEWGSQGDAAARRLLAEADSEFELAPHETVTSALDAVTAGEADAAIVDAISLALYSRTGRLASAGDPLVSDPYVVVVAADAPDLLNAVNNALRALETDGTLTAIRQRWLRP